MTSRLPAAVFAIWPVPYLIPAHQSRSRATGCAVRCAVGSIAANTDTQLQANRSVCEEIVSDRTPVYQYDLLLGYKYGLLEDELSVNQSSTYLAAADRLQRVLRPPTAFDRFSTSNRFNGFVIGRTAGKR